MRTTVATSMDRMYILERTTAGAESLCRIHSICVTWRRLRVPKEPSVAALEGRPFALAA